jgi:hypothetical protein
MNSIGEVVYVLRQPEDFWQPNHDKKLVRALIDSNGNTLHQHFCNMREVVFDKESQRIVDNICKNILRCVSAVVTFEREKEYQKAQNFKNHAVRAINMVYTLPDHRLMEPRNVTFEGVKVEGVIRL